MLYNGKSKKTYIIFAFVTVQYVREGVWCEAERGQSLSTLVWCDNANVMLEVGHGDQCTLLARTANIIQCSASIPSHLQTVVSGTFQKLPIKFFQDVTHLSDCYLSIQKETGIILNIVNDIKLPNMTWLAKCTFNKWKGNCQIYHLENFKWLSLS